MRAVSRTRDEAGVALITALLVTMMVTALMAGMFAAINADVRSHAIDRDQTQVYAAAHAGLEKLTSDLAQLFVTNFNPTSTQLNALTGPTRLPNISGFDYVSPGGAAGSGYAISWTPDTGANAGNPKPEPDANINAGPYTGFKGILTKYTVTVTGHSTGGSEVRLRRELQTVAVPVFQFGVFSDTDLTFYGGDNFNFGGRVHTNGNLFLAEASGSTLLFTDRITAWGDVVRKYLSNGLDAGTYGMSGTVNILSAVGNLASAKNLAYTPKQEGSIGAWPPGSWSNAATPVWTDGAATNTNPAWSTTSQTKFLGNISNRRTGATVLRLPLTSQGATPIDLIRRPAVNSNEDTANQPVFGQRYFGPLASVRILLSDRTTDITNLPTVTGTAPVQLTGNWLTAPPNNGTAYGPVDATHAPIARAVGPISVSTTTGSTYTSPYAQIRVNGNIPSGFMAPSLTVSSSLGSATATCTGRTITTFTGCTVTAPGIAVNGTASAALPSGLTVSAQVSVAVTAGSSRTITLSTSSSAQPTARFAPGLLWVGGAAVTCEGYSNVASAQQFTNCRGLTAAPGNNVTISTHAHANEGTDLIGGFIKIEKQNAAGAWSDVTMEILNLGIAAPNQEGVLCADPSPTAVIRIQRLRDNGNGSTGGICTYAGSLNPHDYWPNALYDAREGNFRPVGTTIDMNLGGVMSYISLDVNNLRRWLAGEIGTTGTQTRSNNGYVVYFSDRRGDHNESITGDPETAEYGAEDFVNPASSTGTPNTTLQTGEDVNANGSLDRYGESPHSLAIPAGTPSSTSIGAALTWSSAGRPWSVVANEPEARVNRQLLFRRALKLVSGGVSGGVTRLPAGGLTVASENPVYVQGNYNATNDPNVANDPHVPAAVIADAVTVLSNRWTDSQSFKTPNDAAQRLAQATGYRFAVITGKGLSFPYPTAGTPQFLFGTGRRHGQLPAPARGLARHRLQLPRLDGQPVHQPPGHRCLQVPHQRLRLRRPQLQVRRRLPRPGTAPAGDADVSRREHVEVPADPAAESVDRRWSGASF